MSMSMSSAVVKSRMISSLSHTRTLTLERFSVEQTAPAPIEIELLGLAAPSGRARGPMPPSRSGKDRLQAETINKWALQTLGRSPSVKPPCVHTPA